MNAEFDTRGRRNVTIRKIVSLFSPRVWLNPLLDFAILLLVAIAEDDNRAIFDTEGLNEEATSEVINHYGLPNLR